MRRRRKGAQQAAEVSIRGVVGAAAAVVAAIVLALVLSRALLAGLGAGIHDPVRTPREQPHPIADYQQYRAAEQARLASYAWVDREAGTVQIPIERAMSLVAKDEPGATAADGKRP